MFELAICLVVKFKSDLMASGMSGGKANQLRNATKKPTESPYTSESLASAKCRN